MYCGAFVPGILRIADIPEMPVTIRPLPRSKAFPQGGDPDACSTNPLFDVSSWIPGKVCSFLDRARDNPALLKPSAGLPFGSDGPRFAGLSSLLCPSAIADQLDWLCRDNWVV
jgi:hypothetical protein